MNITLSIPKEYDAKYLQVKARVRYWADAEINGISDTLGGDNIPCRIDKEWCPKINIDTGIIENWEQGKTADIHYKVVDECSYSIIDDQSNTILEMHNEYVPAILYPKEKGFGDYIMMRILEDGTIENWDKHKLFSIINND